MASHVLSFVSRLAAPALAALQPAAKARITLSPGVGTEPSWADGKHVELVSQQSCWVDGRELGMRLLRRAHPASHLTPALVRASAQSGLPLLSQACLVLQSCWHVHDHMQRTV